MLARYRYGAEQCYAILQGVVAINAEDNNCMYACATMHRDDTTNSTVNNSNTTQQQDDNGKIHYSLTL